MHDITLISEDDILNATGSSAARFSRLVKVADENFEHYYDMNNVDKEFVRILYMKQISEVADALGIPGMFRVATPPIAKSEWDSFVGSVRAAQVGGLIRSSATPVLESDNLRIELSTSAEVRLRRSIRRLYDLLDEVDLSSNKKEKILKKIRELEDALNQDKVDLLKLLQMAAAAATIFGSTMAGIANGPEAIETIFEIVQIAGEAAEHSETTLALPPPLKALPAPEPKG